MSLSAIRTALAGASITGIRGFAQVPDTIEPPCFIVFPSHGTPHETFGTLGTIRHYLEAHFLVVKGGTVTGSQDTLDALLAPTGGGSAFVGFYGADLSGVPATMVNMGYRNYGPFEFAGQPYVGFVMDLEVWEG